MRFACSQVPRLSSPVVDVRPGEYGANVEISRRVIHRTLLYSVALPGNQSVPSSALSESIFGPEVRGTR